MMMIGELQTFPNLESRNSILMRNLLIIFTVARVLWVVVTGDIACNNRNFFLAVNPLGGTANCSLPQFTLTSQLRRREMVETVP